MESSNPLPELVLADEQVVGDILNCLSGPKQQDLQDPNLLVQTAATIVAAVGTFERVTL